MTKLSIKERTTVEARIWQMLTCDGYERHLDHMEFPQETSLNKSCGGTKAEIFELSRATAD